MRASIKISDAGFGPITLAVVLLATLLSGFFWLGYWVSETSLAKTTPQPQGPQIIQIPLPNIEDGEPREQCTSLKHSSPPWAGAVNSMSAERRSTTCRRDETGKNVQ